MELLRTFLNPWLIPVMILGGPVFSEFSGYIWHRWVAHRGVLRWLPNDFLRRRHFDHHESPDKYSVEHLRSKVYVESCEVAFKFLSLILIPIIIVTVVLGWAPFAYAVAIVVGASCYSKFFQSRLHNSYHIEYEVLYKSWLFRPNWIKRLHLWLRDCHDIHHWINANYFILIPAFDWIMGSLVTKRSLEKKNRTLIKEDIFPKFKPELVGTCNTPVFGIEQREE